MHIAYIGLGKMGLNMVERLREKKHDVTAYDPNEKSRERARALGASVATSLTELMQQVKHPRTVWLMIPHGAVDNVLTELATYITKGDLVIDGGNSPFKETMRRAQEHEAKGINYLDAGVSGGPDGAKAGACIMVGGRKEVFANHEQLFKDLSVEEGYAYMGKSGAGHFVKMVHNGIEYGMMQSIAEGFDVMRTSDFDLNLIKVAKLYNHGSVIESRLVSWLKNGFEKYGENLAGITGSASASGEGLWTIETAKEMGIPVAVIEDSLKARELSQKKPSYQGQLISVMRNMFGGHHAQK